MTVRQPPPSETERCATIADRTGLAEETVTRARWIARHAWAPPTVEVYLEDPWPFERADCPDSQVRI